MIVVVRRPPQLRPSLRTLPFVALAAAVGLLPMAITGLPVIVRLVISTTLFGGVVLLTRTLPAELIDLAPWIGGRIAARGEAARDSGRPPGLGATRPDAAA